MILVLFRNMQNMEENMIIKVGLSIIPEKINPDLWCDTYEEALMLCKKLKLIYVQKRVIDGIEVHLIEQTCSCFDELGYQYFEVSGTLEVGSVMARHRIYKDFSFYNTIQNNKDGTITIWEENTYGREGHIELLAIACLFCDRLKNAVKVYGNITYGQCLNACALANQYLQTTIELPYQCRYERIYLNFPECGLKSFDYLQNNYIGDKTKDHYIAFIREKYNMDIIYEWYCKNIQYYQSYYQWQYIRDWLESGFGFEQLTKLMVLDENGPKLTMEEWIKKIIYYQIHIPNKICGNISNYFNPNVAEPYGESQLFQFWLLSAENCFNQNIPFYLPKKEILSICQSIQPIKQIEEIWENATNQYLQDEKYQKALQEEYEAYWLYQREEKSETISFPEHLYFWKEGTPIAKKLLTELIVSYAAAYSIGYQMLCSYHNPSEVLKDLLESTSKNPLPKEVYEFIVTNINHNEWIAVYFMLLNEMSSQLIHHEIKRALLINHKLYLYLFEISQKVK